MCKCSFCNCRSCQSVGRKYYYFLSINVIQEVDLSSSAKRTRYSLLSGAADEVAVDRETTVCCGKAMFVLVTGKYVFMILRTQDNISNKICLLAQHMEP